MKLDKARSLTYKQAMQLNANKVFDVLVKYAGARESLRDDFVHNHPCQEYRFQGNLGFGGKYYSRGNRVSCYQEDETPERAQIIKQTNHHLTLLEIED